MNFTEEVGGVRFLDGYRRAEGERFWESLAAQGMVDILDGVPLQHAPAVLMSYDVARDVVSAANAVQAAMRVHMESWQDITKRLESRAPRFAGVSLNMPTINTQVAERIEKGFRPPLAYDIIFTKGKDGCIRRTTVEFQMAIAYTGWMQMKADAAIHAVPGLNRFEYFWNDPLRDVASLKGISGGRTIHVFDVDSRIDPTADKTNADKNYMARILGHAKSRFVCPVDLFRRDGAWYVNVRNNGKVVAEEKVEYVVSRILPGELKQLEDYTSDKPEMREMLLEFFTDASLQWIWPPAMQNFIDKQDLGMLQSCPETREHASRVFTGGERAAQGVYRMKPYNENSGKAQKNVTVGAEGEIVPEGHVFQELFDPYPFQVPVFAPGFPDVMEATLEIRALMPPSFGIAEGDASATFMFRLAPRTDPSGEIVMTNIGAIQRAVYAWKKYYSPDNNVSHKDFPFGFGTAFVG